MEWASQVVFAHDCLFDWVKKPVSRLSNDCSSRGNEDGLVYRSEISFSFGSVRDKREPLLAMQPLDFLCVNYLSMSHLLLIVENQNFRPSKVLARY